MVLINRDCAKESTGHGSPLPVLIHGGPGRAGGGEEMGGIRGVKHAMQRTALQGSPSMLSAIIKQYLPGSITTEGDIHPFRKRLSELEIGYSLRTGSRTVTLEDIEHFAHFTGDTFVKANVITRLLQSEVEHVQKDDASLVLLGHRQGERDGVGRVKGEVCRAHDAPEQLPLRAGLVAVTNGQDGTGGPA